MREVFEEVYMEYRSQDIKVLDSVKKRIAVLLLFSGAVFFIYTYHLFSLQITHGIEYRQRSTLVSRRSALIPTQRGEIFDRHYDLELAMNIDSFAVDVIPAQLDRETKPVVVRKLSELLSMNEEVIARRISERTINRFRPVEIKDNIDYETIVYLSENIDKFPGVLWRNKPVRSYPDSGSLVHILGYVGGITREELLQLYNKGYSPNSVIGKMGIERMYDEVLRGTDGVRYTTVDVKGRKIREFGVEEIPPETGSSLVLTIDRHIQKLCEKALGERSGSVVVLKPSTGEILAMVSYPWFDPNVFYTGNLHEYYRTLSRDPGFPFLNRAVQSVYAPASSFKIVMSTAILEEEVFSPYERIECRGKITLGDRVFNCHKKTGHGRLDLEGGLAQSCDVYYWTVGRDYLGVEKIAEYSRRFGFGQFTGIDLPGEARGLVPTPQWKERVYGIPWVGGDTYNMSIGQGFLEVTNLQMANSVAMVVNDGVIHVPHLVKQVRDFVSGEIIEETEPRILHHSTIRKDVFDTVKDHMRGVITNGTANVVITTDAVKVAGKTGTGEVGLDENWTSWFAAYAPFDSDNPDEQVVVSVMVEAVNDWDWWAPKAANIIFQGIFAEQTYEEAVLSLNAWYLREKQAVIRSGM